MNVPFVDFKEQYYAIKDKIDTGLKSVFEKGNFILGEEAKKFEEEFAAYCGTKYGVGVNSGTDALFLAVAALGVGEGDEVILPSFTFIATALGVSYTGAKPVFIDVEDDTYNLDPKQLEKLITKKTKAIIPVHLYGQSANMDEILEIAKRKNVPVIEDSAQAHGTTYKGKRIGTFGDMACFSFYPTKGLGAFGDGGIVLTSNDKLYEKVKMLRDYGRVGRYEHVMIGYNTRLDTVQAVILSAKLKHLDQWNKMRQAHAKVYEQLLKVVPGVVTPKVKDDREHVYQTYAIRLKNRGKVIEGLKNKGIGVLIHYPIPVHLQPAYKDLKYKKGDFPVSEKLADEVLSLPMYPHMQKEQIAYVCSAIKELV